jgi:hypothetical protein
MRRNNRKYSRKRTHYENLSPDEHKLICYLRHQRRRAVGQSVKFKVIVNSGIKIEPIKEVQSL